MKMMTEVSALSDKRKARLKVCRDSNSAEESGYPSFSNHLRKCTGRPAGKKADATTAPVSNLVQQRTAFREGVHTYGVARPIWHSATEDLCCDVRSCEFHIKPSSKKERGICSFYHVVRIRSSVGAVRH